MLNFKDASLHAVLEYLSEAAGLVIVEEARVEGRVTVLSRQHISVEEAAALLDTVLKQKGYAAIRNGRVLRIVTIEQAKKDLIPVRLGNDPNKIEPTDRMVTQVIPIRSADAARLKSDLASLIPTSADVASNAASNTLIVTGTQATVRRIVEIIRAIDVGMSEVLQVKVFQLKFANATNAARLVTEIFREDQTGQTSGSQFGGRRGFMFPGMPGGDGGGGDRGGGGGDQGRRAPKVTASADERTNTLVVSAAPDVMKAIESVIKELDSNPTEDQAVFIYRMKNAQAKNLESILNSMFGGSGTTGTSTIRQGTGGTGTGFSAGGAFGGSGRGGTSGGSSRGGTSSGRGLSTGGPAHPPRGARPVRGGARPDSAPGWAGLPWARRQAPRTCTARSTSSPTRTPTRCW
jgi:general secretion pathway protein D